MSKGKILFEQTEKPKQRDRVGYKKSVQLETESWLGAEQPCRRRHPSPAQGLSTTT